MAKARRVGSVVGVALLVAFGGAGSALAEAEPGSAEGASVLKTGWWWRVNENPTAGTDVNPGAPPTPVESGALPVSAVLGEPEKLSAIEFALEAEPPGTVTSFVLSLRESEDQGANANADSEDSVVAACQITEMFWVDGEGEAWGSKPEYDEDNCVPAERSDEGIWTFELTSLAAAWLADDPEPASVVLVSQVEAPQSFQVTFDGVEDDGIGVLADLEGSAGEEGSDMPGAEGSSIADGFGDLGEPGAGDGGLDGDLGGTGGDGDSGGFAGGDEAPEAAGAPGDAGEGDAAAAPDAELAASPMANRPGVFDGIPWGVWFLLPVVLGTAYLLMIALGPRGDLATGLGRQGGVSRALERLRSDSSAAKGA